MQLDIPVDPDAGTARQWARDELAKSEYSSGGTNVVERFVRWLQHAIQSLGGNVGHALGPWGTVAAVVIGLALVALVVWIVVGPLRRARRRPDVDGPLGDPTMRSADLFAEAEAAASAGDWPSAVIAAYRALVRDLDERRVISVRPGMTAHEAAIAAGTAMPGIASAIADDADVFDGVRYGHLAANERHYRHMLETRAQARRATVEVTA